MEWIFDGIGTLLIGLVIGGGTGAAAGWNLAVHRIKLIQRAGDNADQIQVIGGGNLQPNVDTES